MKPKGGYIYIMSNKHRNVIYVGITANLSARTYEHRNNVGGIFTKKYACNDLVYFESFEDIESAIKREKQLKNWKREWKDELIKSKNPELRDLFDEVREFV